MCAWSKSSWQNVAVICVRHGVADTTPVGHGMHPGFPEFAPRLPLSRVNSSKRYCNSDHHSPALLQSVQRYFTKVARMRVDASRSSSREFFAIALGRKAPQPKEG